MDETRGTPEGGTSGDAGANRDPVTGAGEPTRTTRGEATHAGTPKRGRGRGVLWAIAAVVLAFLIGFGWQYYRATGIQDSLEATEQQLAVETLQLGLAQAALAAQTGEFEVARQQMSEFFNSAQDQMAELPPDIQQTLREILTMRDDVITGLSRSNAEYAGVIHGFLDRFQGAREETPAPAVDDTL